MIHKHPGLLPAREGGAVDIVIDGKKPLANSDFSAEALELSRVSVSGVYVGTNRADRIIGAISLRLFPFTRDFPPFDWHRVEPTGIERMAAADTSNCQIGAPNHSKPLQCI